MKLMKSVEKIVSAHEKKLAIRRIQTVALRSIHEFFFEESFDQLMPILLSPITDPLGPDPGSSVIKTGVIEYQGQRLQLTQSMILHKQIAIGMGIEKLYIVSPNVRLEGPQKHKTGIHAFEFSQVDFELVGRKMDDIFEFVESLLRKIKFDVKMLAEEELKLLGREFPIWESKFPRYTSHELLEKYGEDWEELSSVTETTPYWVICHKREFYDLLDRDAEGEHYLNYDLYYPEGYKEALSGAEREYKHEHIVERILSDGFELSAYHSYVEAAKAGRLLPSAGGGIGVERLVRYLTGQQHISDIQIFERIPGRLVDV